VRVVIRTNDDNIFFSKLYSVLILMCTDCPLSVCSVCIIMCECKTLMSVHNI
jgi:hypothetical protein